MHRVELHLHDVVGAQDGAVRVLVGPIQNDAVRLGLVLDRLFRRRLDAAIAADRVHGQDRVRVGGAEQPFAGPVGRRIGDAGGQRRVGDVAELAGCLVNAETRDREGLSANGMLVGDGLSAGTFTFSMTSRSPVARFIPIT